MWKFGSAALWVPFWKDGFVTETLGNYGNLWYFPENHLIYCFDLLYFPYVDYGKAKRPSVFKQHQYIYIFNGLLIFS